MTIECRTFLIQCAESRVLSFYSMGIKQSKLRWLDWFHLESWFQQPISVRAEGRGKERMEQVTKGYKLKRVRNLEKNPADGMSYMKNFQESLQLWEEIVGICPNRKARIVYRWHFFLLFLFFLSFLLCFCFLGFFLLGFFFRPFFVCFLFFYWRTCKKTLKFQSSCSLSQWKIQKYMHLKYFHCIFYITSIINKSNWACYKSKLTPMPK